MPEDLHRRFEDALGGMPQAVARAPGRVNLIGEHTDYSGGFVLPMALDLQVRLAFRARTDDAVRLWSAQEGTTVEFDLSSSGPPDQGWGAYPWAVARVLADRGFDLRGFEGVLDSTVPVGAGLSSSAALELAVARALIACIDGPWDAREMALACQAAERDLVGVACGPMDQLISGLGQPGHALLIDCRSLRSRPIAVPNAARVVVLDTGTRRQLATSAYNARRDQVEAAARVLGVETLRDVQPTQLESADLDPVLARRARHVVHENRRTVAAADALAAGNLAETGRLMNESHHSLRDDFDVSGPELDVMAEVARSHPGCHGARMTGAGFAGCAVALVDVAAVGSFGEQVMTNYRRATGRDGRFYVSGPAAGASL